MDVSLVVLAANAAAAGLLCLIAWLASHVVRRPSICWSTDRPALRERHALRKPTERGGGVARTALRPSKGCNHYDDIQRRSRVLGSLGGGASHDLEDAGHVCEALERSRLDLAQRDTRFGGKVVNHLGDKDVPGIGRAADPAGEVDR